METEREFYVVMYDTFAIVGIVFRLGTHVIDETIRREPEWDGEVPRSLEFGSAERLKREHPWLTDEILRYCIALPSKAQQVILNTTPEVF